MDDIKRGDSLSDLPTVLPKTNQDRVRRPHSRWNSKKKKFRTNTEDTERIKKTYMYTIRFVGLLVTTHTSFPVECRIVCNTLRESLYENETTNVLLFMIPRTNRVRSWRRISPLFEWPVKFVDPNLSPRKFYCNRSFLLLIKLTTLNTSVVVPPLFEVGRGSLWEGESRLVDSELIHP